MDIPGPQNARGRILYDIVEDAEHLTGGHDPRHQRLPRAADPARPRRRTTSVPRPPTFAIGGSAFLKKWFEIYEAEAALSDKQRRRDRDGRR